ncbi:MAG: hypothetical protein ACM3WU_04425 [Bacillota bacterium]
MDSSTTLAELRAMFEIERPAEFPDDELAEVVKSHAGRRWRSLWRAVYPDVSEYYLDLLGLASGGIRRASGDRDRYTRTQRFLRPFAEVYPQYVFLMDIDRDKYPRLSETFSRMERIRKLLLTYLALAGHPGQ